MREIFAVIVFLAALTTSQNDAPPDPFGDNTTVALAGRLVETWRTIRGELAGDHALLGACVDSTKAKCAQARALWRIIDDAKQQHGLAVIGHINRAINFSIVPFEPSEWLTALDAMNGAADCQGYATAKYFALREAGIPAERVRLVIVHQRGHVEDHMVTAVWNDGIWLILDNGTLVTVPDTQTKYMPLFVLDDDGVRRYIAAPSVS